MDKIYIQINLGGILPLIINCSENCIYEKEGICNLKHVTYSSGTPSKDCPYFKEKQKHKNRD